MGKVKSLWFCSSCGGKHAKWTGQCLQCAEWNTLHEEIEIPSATQRFTTSFSESPRPLPLTEISPNQISRLTTQMLEWDRLLGGGIVPGSLTLVGGDPGIGKSTLLLQLSHRLAEQNRKVLYVCGEESIEQTSLRAQRLGITSANLFLLSETHFSSIRAHIDAVKPEILIADSVQVIYKSELSSAPGSVSQVREVAAEFMHLAKGQKIATFLIGHVTKAGEIAGPRVLEHLVDTVLYFEGDKQHHYRMIRVVKNRFGPTDEMGVFQMTERGLVEIPNPSEIFLRERQRDIIGSTIIPTIEGSRALLIEVQSLVTETAYSTPSRRSTGIDQNRLALLLAVLEKRVGYPMHRCDVFASVAGGMRILEPAIDLGVALSITSSLRNRSLDPDLLVFGEIGLGGEVRSVPRVESRIKEAMQMGFRRCILPKSTFRAIPPSLQEKITIHPVEMVEQAIEIALS